MEIIVIITIRCGTQETSNAIPNLAEVLKEVLNHDNTIGKIIPMLDGETNVKKAIDTL